jgi:integral membrane protein (TIGR00529 family)
LLALTPFLLILAPDHCRALAERLKTSPVPREYFTVTPNNFFLAAIMDISESSLALIKLAGVFALLIVLLRLHVHLWLAILAAALGVVVSSGMWPNQWPSVITAALTRPDFILLCVMVFLIMLLSAIQDASGQSRRLVEGLKRYLDKPRLQLVIFPALVGFLPMPGGALFSCPMVEAVARDMKVSDQRKSLINYWFRHIWELAWPLYPGYALVCSLLGISMTLLWQFTFPLVFLAFAIGWLFFMRNLMRGADSPGVARAQAEQRERDGLAWSEADAAEAARADLLHVLLNALPIGVTLLGAAVFALLFDLLLPDTPGQTAFALSLVCAVAVALYQGRGHMSKSLPQLALSKNTGRIMLLLVAIYIFKESIGASGIVRQMSQFGDSALLIPITFVLLPFISGLLTGVMVGYVGLCFPILLAILDHSTLGEYRLPLILLAMSAGNCGQLVSPLHICLVVTCEYFNTRLPALWRRLLAPVGLLLLGGAVWAGVIALAGLSLHS